MTTMNGSRASLKDDVLAQVNLPDLVRSSGVQLNRSNKEYKGFCPFHKDEHTPNFTVYDKGKGWRFHCFACGAHGNAIDFVAQHEGLDFKEALDKLADREGIPTPMQAGAPLPKAPKPTKAAKAAKANGENDVYNSCTLQQYAADKGLDMALLRKLGLTDTSYRRRPAVRIPFYDVDGKPVALQFRTALKKEKGGPDNRVRNRKGD